MKTVGLQLLSILPLFINTGQIQINLIVFIPQRNVYNVILSNGNKDNFTLKQKIRLNCKIKRLSCACTFCIVSVKYLYCQCVLNVSLVCTNCIVSVYYLYCQCVLAVLLVCTNCIVSVHYLYFHLVCSVYYLYCQCVLSVLLVCTIFIISVY